MQERSHPVKPVLQVNKKQLFSISMSHAVFGTFLHKADLHFNVICCAGLTELLYFYLLSLAALTNTVTIIPILVNPLFCFFSLLSKPPSHVLLYLSVYTR